MSTSINKIVLTITAGTIQAEAFIGSRIISSRTTEVMEYGQAINHQGDDVFETLPAGLAVAIDAMELPLDDIAIDLIEEAA